MSTQAWFAIPLYVTKASGEVYNEIQEELQSCCNQRKFSRFDNWPDHTHELSDNAFSENVLKDCPKFLDFLHVNLMSYMDDIRCKSSREYEISTSWFTKTKHLKRADLHDHGGSDLSGVYYLQTNGRDGNLEFIDPHRSYATNYIFQSVTIDEPKLPLEQGLMAFWPGMIWHRTQSNQTQDERISLSFNISFRRGSTLNSIVR